MTSPRIRLALAAALVLAPLACSGGGDGGSATPGPTEPPPTNNPPPSTSTVDTIRMSGTSFEPSELTVRPGRTVVWVNTQSIFHTVTPEGHTQWSRATTNAAGEVLRVTFNAVGAFPYHCEPHRASGMTGRITVQQ